LHDNGDVDNIQFTGNIDVSDLIVGAIALASLLWLVISHIQRRKPKLKLSISPTYYMDEVGHLSKEPTHWTIECVNINDPPIIIERFGILPPFSAYPTGAFSRLLVKYLFRCPQNKWKRLEFGHPPKTLKRADKLSEEVPTSEIIEFLQQSQSYRYGFRYFTRDSYGKYHIRRIPKWQMQKMRELLPAGLKTDRR